MSPSKSKNLTPSYAVIQGLYWMYFAAIMSFPVFFFFPVDLPILRLESLQL